MAIINTGTSNGYQCPSCGIFTPSGQVHLCAGGSTSFDRLKSSSIVTGNELIHSKLDEILRLIRQRKNRECFICGQEKQCWTDLPYGSFYDGQVICGDCCAKYIDPLLDLVRIAKGEAQEE